MRIKVLESTVNSFDFADTLMAEIYDTFGCDVDDMNFDQQAFPDRAAMSFVVYNVSAKVAEDICDKLEQLLSDGGYDIWRGHSVDFEKDSSYIGGPIKSAYKIRFSVNKESESSFI